MMCPECGWSWATTYTPPIMMDKKSYTLMIPNRKPFTLLDVKNIALSFHITYLQARKELSAGTLTHTASAREIKELAHNLVLNGIDYSITPEFPYKI